MSGTVHVVGAGLAGLATAVGLVNSGARIVFYESTDHAGGRCRSFFDDTLGCLIDNGNHLMLSGNRSAMSYLTRIGAEDSLIPVEHAVFPFVDLVSGARWTVRPNRGPVPYWILLPGRRVPGSTAGQYLGAWRLRRAPAEAAFAGCFDPDDAAYRHFWEPLAVAVTNTAADEAAAALMWPLMTEILSRGEAAVRPRIAARGLTESLVEPAVTRLTKRGVTFRFNARLRGLTREGGRVAGMNLNGETVPVEPGDAVVLAVPSWSIRGLVPEIDAPDEARPIVNAHFRLSEAPRQARVAPLMGLVGGTAHWLFFRDSIVSVTVSAATDLVNEPAERIAATLWADVAAALECPNAVLPPHRIIKEKRATFAQTPAQVARRTGPATPFDNLFLAGDWTDTGLPATIEGAIRSGGRAASAVLTARQWRKTA